MTNFEVADNYLDWEIGTHGIWIEFIQTNGKKETATYLPEVMKNQGWTKEEAIKSLLRKGGFYGPVTKQYCIISITLTRYQSQKLEQPYKGWLFILSDVTTKTNFNDENLQSNKWILFFVIH